MLRLPHPSVGNEEFNELLNLQQRTTEVSEKLTLGPLAAKKVGGLSYVGSKEPGIPIRLLRLTELVRQKIGRPLLALASGVDWIVKVKSAAKWTEYVQMDVDIIDGGRQG